MESGKLLYDCGKQSGSDEAYTPMYGVIPILEYVKKDQIVWCPFDTEESNFVIALKKMGVKVVSSHIQDGKDFFEYEPEEWDVIISNPPFKNKRKFFERAISFKKPFALLMTLAWLNDRYSKQVFINGEIDMQLLMFDKRIKFENPYGRDNNKITFSSGYYCNGFLDKDIVLKEIDIHASI